MKVIYNEITRRGVTRNHLGAAVSLSLAGGGALVVNKSLVKNLEPLDLIYAHVCCIHCCLESSKLSIYKSD